MRETNRNKAEARFAQNEWRIAISSAIVRLVFSFGLIACILGIWWSLANKDFAEFAVLGISGIGIVVLFVASKKLGYVNSWILVVVGLVCGIGQSLADAPHGSGFSITLATIALSALLLEKRSAMAVIAIGILGIVSATAMYGFGILESQKDLPVGISWWLSWASSFVLMSLMVSVPIVYVVGRLTQSLDESTKDKVDLERSELKYRTIYNSANDAILQMDGLTVIDCNTKALEIFGCTAKDQLIGMTPVDYSPEFQESGVTSQDYAEMLVIEALAGKPQRFRYKHIRKNGEPMDAEVTLNAIDFEGKTLLQAIVRDVTEATRISNELNKTVKRLQILTEMDRSIINRDHPRETLNTMLCNLRQVVRYDFATVIADPWEESTTSMWWQVAKVCDPESEEKLSKVIEICSEERDTIVNSQYSLLSTDPKDASLKPLYDKFVAVEGIESALVVPFGYANSFRGILILISGLPHVFNEEHVRIGLEVANQSMIAIRLFRQNAYIRRRAEYLENEVRKRTEQLSQSNKELESFSYSVSHDLRAPLRAISGFAKMLTEDAGDLLNEECKGYLIRIEASSNQMSTLIDDLLKLSRIGKTRLVRTENNLTKMATQILEELAEYDQDRTVMYEVQPDINVHADENLLRIAMQNMLRNAWKYTARTDHPLIRVFADQENGEQTITIQDNGAGFDPNYTDKLFQPFQRLHSAKEYEGTGIGLALTSRIIGRHNGRIWAEGEVGKGAAFHFTLGNDDQTENENVLAAPSVYAENPVYND